MLMASQKIAAILQTPISHFGYPVTEDTATRYPCEKSRTRCKVCVHTCTSLYRKAHVKDLQYIRVYEKYLVL